MTQLLRSDTNSDGDYENLVAGLSRIQLAVSITHQKAKQVRQQQTEAQVKTQL